MGNDIFTNNNTSNEITLKQSENNRVNRSCIYFYNNVNSMVRCHRYLDLLKNTSWWLCIDKTILPRMWRLSIMKDYHWCGISLWAVSASLLPQEHWIDTFCIWFCICILFPFCSFCSFFVFGYGYGSCPSYFFGFCNLCSFFCHFKIRSKYQGIFMVDLLMTVFLNNGVTFRELVPNNWAEPRAPQKSVTTHFSNVVMQFMMVVFLNNGAFVRGGIVVTVAVPQRVVGQHSSG